MVENPCKLRFCAPIRSTLHAGIFARLVSPPACPKTTSTTVRTRVRRELLGCDVFLPMSLAAVEAPQMTDRLGEMNVMREAT